MKRIDWFVRAVENIAILVATAALFIIMVLLFVDPIGRYVFNSPIAFAYDLIGHNLFAATFFLALAYTMRNGNHVSVDIMIELLPGGVRRIVSMLGYLTALALCVFLTYLSADDAWRDWSSGARRMGALPWPLWPTQSLVPFGFALLSARLLILLVQTATGPEYSQASNSKPTDY